MTEALLGVLTPLSLVVIGGTGRVRDEEDLGPELMRVLGVGLRKPPHVPGEVIDGLRELVEGERVHRLEPLDELDNGRDRRGLGEA